MYLENCLLSYIDMNLFFWCGELTPEVCPSILDMPCTGTIISEELAAFILKLVKGETTWNYGKDGGSNIFHSIDTYMVLYTASNPRRL
jgi:hypothetical protein